MLFVTITGNLEQFQIKKTKKRKFFEKLEYWFLVESTKIDNITFPYKTVLSEANVKTNRMGSTKLTYHKEQSFASNHFPFSKILFQFRTSYIELIWCTKHLNVHIHTFQKRWSFPLGYFFPEYL